tara:strand:- start:9 stop:155 length:147 start_codon:yes stop_codon:yes gene_type:complete
LVVELPLTVLKFSAVDHCIVYAGLFNPVPLSFEEDQLMVGVVSVVGEL